MSNKLKEVIDIANDIFVEYVGEIEFKEAMDLAVRIQHNRILEDAFMTGSDNYAGALERIAMELGASSDHLTIKDAIYEISRKND